MNYDAYTQAHYDYWERISIISPLGDIKTCEASQGHKEALTALREAVSSVEALKIMRIVKDSAECLTKEEFKVYD